MIPRRVLAPLFPLLCALPALSSQQGAPPVALPGGPYLVECAGSTTFVEVDGSASYDPDGTPVTYEWFEECELGFFDHAHSAKAVFVLENDAPCGHECSHIELRVTSGGQTTRERFTIAVADTTPPALLCPQDQVAVWGASLSPLYMGMAGASDACGGEPVVNWVDTHIPGEQCSGIEEVIKRDWIASDACGNFSEDTQYITLLSPSGGCHGTPPTNLELDPGVCENVFDLGDGSAFFRANLLGRGAFQVAEVDPASVRLFRLDQPTQRVRAFRPRRTPMGDWIKAAAFQFKTCSPAGQDGNLDLSFRFLRKQVGAGLGLDELAPGTRVTLVLAGRTRDGLAFWAGDDLVIADESGAGSH